MKKTIIAASIAAVVAAPAAFADVSISGMINYELADEAASK
jgi:opacity protein-like surface antigen